jgi:hypothetical protein
VDFHHAIYRGTRASVEIRQTVQEKYQPELFVASNVADRQSAFETAVCARIDRLQATYPGIGCETAGEEVHIVIPDRYRLGHEAHFGQVVEEFLKYLKSPKSMPAWERPNMLAKYFVTTTGVQMSRPS